MVLVLVDGIGVYSVDSIEVLNIDIDCIEMLKSELESLLVF